LKELESVLFADGELDLAISEKPRLIEVEAAIPVGP
jgi:hypothetical protein